MKLKGYFGIGLYHPKFVENQGTLWRSAYQMGADYIYTINGRFRRQNSDTVRASDNIPCYEYDDFYQFHNHIPKGCVLVAIETGGRSLESFCHPKQAVYLLGAEDHGIPKTILDYCQHTISIPSIRHYSYNVSVAGSLVMYDRLCKIQSGVRSIA